MELFGDLGKSLKAWGRDPLLPVISAALVVPSLLTRFFTESSLIPMLGILAVSIFAIGFPGTQRIWYLRLWEGERIRPGELWTLTWSFAPTFFGLALFFCLLFVPLALLALVFGKWAGLVAVCILDMIFTFATPAATVSTDRANEAFSIGLRMLRNHLGHALPYIVVPPLAVQVLVFAPQSRLDVQRGLAVGIAATLLNLLFKGATLAYYVRNLPVGEGERLLSREAKS